MNQIDGTLILLFLPLAIMLCGYWLAAQLPENSALERLALALLFGLGLLLASVAAVNFSRPLSGLWAYACLLPGLPSLLPRNLVLLWRDITAILRTRPAAIVLTLTAYLVLMLWPVLRAPDSLFYDGTSNHDSFFWVAGAEHLKSHSYMEMPANIPTQPARITAAAIVGWKPAWGRMGAEGLLALASSIIGVSPLKLYLYATASLYLAWLAAAWVALRTFVTDQPGRWTALALVGLQPIFLFFSGNSNLPNLVGALLGASFVVAFERALRSRAAGRRDSDGYLILIALCFHGLLCAYPEMTPFVLMPAGLLWLRHWLRAGFKPGWWPCVLTGGAVLLGAALNYATVVRAYHGFFVSFDAARDDSSWANLLNPLELAEYLPALVTLCVPAARLLGPALGWALTLVLLAGIVLLVRQARDRFGLSAIFSGSIAILVYTVINDFAYGWQKSTQFSGVFFAMVFPAALVHAFTESLGGSNRLNRRLAQLCLTVVPLFIAFATAMNIRETYKWSDRKVISADWFKLRDLSRSTLKAAPVLVEAASFPMAFFHSMWSTYFLTESQVYFGARGVESGGYLRQNVVSEATQAIPTPAAYLVGRRWAETFDASSPRLLTGREFVLLSRANRVLDLSGVHPLNGVPQFASSRIEAKIRPATAATLRFVLAPRTHDQRTEQAITWQLHRLAEDGRAYTAEVGGPPPWRIELPLVPRQSQTVTITQSVPAGAQPKDYPYIVSDLQITRAAVPLSPAAGLLDFSAGSTWEDYALIGLSAVPDLGVVAGPGEAILQFAAPTTVEDVDLELSALRTPADGAPLATEFWFNDRLIFSGAFAGPGVLRVRILNEIWNQHPVAQIKLRFPQNQEAAAGLLLNTLSTRPAASPRP